VKLGHRRLGRPAPDEADEDDAAAGLERDGIGPPRPRGPQLAEGALVRLMERGAGVGVPALDAGLPRGVLQPSFRERRGSEEQPLRECHQQREVPEWCATARSPQHGEG
jgi:hypothetical protein